MESNDIMDYLSASIAGGTVLILLIVNYWLWCIPMNRIRSVDEVGFNHILETGKRKKLAINRLRKTRKAGKMPPAFPNGWFVLAETRDIEPGLIKHVSALGSDFAVFRGEESKKVFVTDAYCPHLGANITVGGSIEGDCVTCPFHEWSFDGNTGKCVDIPYAEKIPDSAKLSTKTCMEANGLIYVWFHSDGIEPTWFPPIMDQLAPSAPKCWVYQGRNEYEISSHIQDIPENGADVAHLNAVHKTTILAGGEPSQWIQSLTQWAWHEWGVRWAPETEEGRQHRAKVELKHEMKVLGGIPLFSLNVVGEQIGPALVHLHFESFMGKGVMIQYVLPLEPMLQKIVHVFYTQRTWLAPYAKMVLLGESILLERDIAVWNSKTYADRPFLVKEDHLIRQHRRWYSQFYSESSPRFAETNGVLDW
ncbi:cholesterol 7-desaturase nvd-like isoform X1 [Tigriopus californicus]|uniref:cholesterol 7-desaturase nvd-like isoform X1 n=1 Tax=Tigriopus californicus TaxID=6832 RepID=UPI0027DA77C9|nr:cholesterol 7-desaturase nvd-like isoform X1 [Tigriopus californicus]XP_059093554.1 cholesterol 7-desaturase nvd-like isoform X1 [Tigriopus californicus]